MGLFDDYAIPDLINIILNITFMISDTHGNGSRVLSCLLYTYLFLFSCRGNGLFTQVNMIGVFVVEMPEKTLACLLTPQQPIIIT